MSGRPEVLCRPDGLHVAESSRLWIVTGRASDYARWLGMLADDPEASDDWPVRLRQETAEVGWSPVAEPLDSDQALLPVDPNNLFFAGIDRRTMVLAAGITVSSVTGASEVGGAVQRDYRSRGYGSEMLAVVCRLMHGHFGVSRLVAGCAVTNTASRRWLAGAGFGPTAGPATRRLPNGRTVRALWWERIDPQAALRCRRPRPAPGRH